MLPLRAAAFLIITLYTAIIELGALVARLGRKD
jgi:hypothetical protein